MLAFSAKSAPIRPPVWSFVRLYPPRMTKCRPLFKNENRTVSPLGLYAELTRGAHLYLAFLWQFYLLFARPASVVVKTGNCSQVFVVHFWVLKTSFKLLAQFTWTPSFSHGADMKPQLKPRLNDRLDRNFQLSWK